MFVIQSPATLTMLIWGQTPTASTPPPPQGGGSPLQGDGAIVGGRMTDRGWQQIRPAAIKWSRQRHYDFVTQTREERARAEKEEAQLSAIQKAEREVERAQEAYSVAEAALNRTITRSNTDKLKAADDRLTAAEDKVAELNSIEYIEKLWANYYKEQEAKKDKRGRN